MRPLLFLVLFSACARCEPVPVAVAGPSDLDPPATEPAPPARPVPATPAANVTRLYRDAEKKEVPAILKEDATVPFIRRIRVAHRDAERAVNALERRNTPTTLTAASKAVRALQDAVDAPPDAGTQ
jgi:hypothetical protein